VLGPFVGVFLDRWLRRRILMASNAIRAILLLVIALLVVRDDVGGLFYLLVLAAFSVNRFLLAGLSASLPHVVSRELLVTANGVSPTCGTLAYLSGVAFGGAVHALSHSDGIVLVVGAVSYFLSALLAWRFRTSGPTLRASTTRSARRLATLSGVLATQPGTCLPLDGWHSAWSARDSCPTA
jgi:MFS family permease